LAEVDFPIAAVSRHAVREKSIRYGHPSTLHLWWARRPLASSRAILLTLLFPDPCDPLCPPEFLCEAGVAVKKFAKHVLRNKHGTERLVADLSTDLKTGNLSKKRQAEQELQRRLTAWRRIDATESWTANDLRIALLQFVATCASWHFSTDEVFLETVKAMIAVVYGEEPPLVVDPFAGGGSIPLEALRIGCETFASDLNPVACLILKVLLEDIPRHGPEMAEELRKAGTEIKRRVTRELADVYPADPDGSMPIAYLWARTVRCEAPDCGAEIPLMRSFWLCRKAKRKRALRHSIERADGVPPVVQFEVFEPKNESQVRAGTVNRAKATCMCCDAVLPAGRVRMQLAAERGGADVQFDADGNRIGGARMTAVVTLHPSQKGRHYRLPTDADYAAVRNAEICAEKLFRRWECSGKAGLSPIPDEQISLNEIRRISVPVYGVTNWGDIFTVRQKVVLAELLDTIINGATTKLKPLLACAFDRVSMSNMSCTRWNAIAEKMQHTFGRQAIPIVWDFAEVVVTAEAPGNWKSGFELIADLIDESVSRESGQTQQADAANHPLPDQSADIWFTDPPYYDAVPYAHLADFFFVWLKRAFHNTPFLSVDLASVDAMVPKKEEIVVDRPHRLSNSIKDAAFYEKGMAQAFAEGRRILNNCGVGSVVFAHKTTEGWEALLSGIIQGGWTITGSWPVATEMGSRLNARETASLATSVHLICRPRPDNAPIGEWAEVLRQLPLRVANWMEHLQYEGVRGADLVFACIGPALEIFSRCSLVETAEGKEIGLSEYLEKVWEVVGRTALEQVLGATHTVARDGTGTLEEDARLTALFLWALQSSGDGESSIRAYDTNSNDDSRSMAGEAPPSENFESAELDEAEEEAVAKATATGFHLPFDVVRRFSQPMGIDLDYWTGRVVAQEKGVVRLLPAAGCRTGEDAFRSRYCAEYGRLDRRQQRREQTNVAFPGAGCRLAHYAWIAVRRKPSRS